LSDKPSAAWYLAPIFLIIILFSSIFFYSNQYAEAQSYSTHSVSESARVLSENIPILGTLEVYMDYTIIFELGKPSLIEAGTTNKITLSPRSGVLTTTFVLDGDVIHVEKNDLSLGSTKTIKLPYTGGVIEVFGKPTMATALLADGPAQVSSNIVMFDSMSRQEFQIYVENEIGNYNSVAIGFPFVIVLEIGATLDFFIRDYELGSESTTIEVEDYIIENIPLRKFYDTRISLQINDGSRYGYAKVYPQLTTTAGQTIQSSDISIYVDGKYTKKARANSWSSDIYTDSGRHNIEARFSETTSSSNSAIIYKPSSQMQSFNVKSPPPTQTPQTTKPALPCGPGTHEEKGLCVPDNGGGCLIATATFGTELAPEVQKLREIRDNILLQTESGKSFMTGFNSFYYSFSPAIADLERQNPLFKEAVKLAITPLITSLSILNYVEIDSEAEMLSYGISLILLNIGMYFVAPAIVIVKFRRQVLH